MHAGRLVAAAVVFTALVVAAGAGASPAPQLRLDGVPFRPELALTAEDRALGLMHRRAAPKDGMLFVYPSETTGAFWMKNTLVSLTIAFFDSEGGRVRKLSMTPCRKDPCPLYHPRRRYQFALELRASDTRKAARLGPLRELRRLARLASWG